MTLQGHQLADGNSNNSVTTKRQKLRIMCMCMRFYVYTCAFEGQIAKPSYILVFYLSNLSAARILRFRFVALFAYASALMTIPAAITGPATSANENPSC